MRTKKYIVGFAQKNKFPSPPEYHAKYMIKIEPEECKAIDEFLQLVETSKIFNVDHKELEPMIDNLRLSRSLEIKMLFASALANNATVHLFTSEEDFDWEDFDMLVTNCMKTGDTKILTDSRIFG